MIQTYSLPRLLEHTVQAMVVAAAMLVATIDAARVGSCRRWHRPPVSSRDAVASFQVSEEGMAYILRRREYCLPDCPAHTWWARGVAVSIKGYSVDLLIRYLSYLYM